MRIAMPICARIAKLSACTMRGMFSLCLRAASICSNSGGLIFGLLISWINVDFFFLFHLGHTNSRAVDLDNSERKVGLLSHAVYAS